MTESGYEALGDEIEPFVGAVRPVHAIGSQVGAAPDQATGRSTGRLAEAGGKAVVNSIIPFRGLVREVSGAAPAQRQLNAAIDAGLARRGYLRGVARGRNCRGG